MSSRFVTYPTWQDVYDVRPTWESLIEEIRPLNRFHSVWLLARINTLLAVDRYHLNEKRTVQLQTRLVNLLIVAREVAEQVADGFGVVVDGGAAYFVEVEAGVECVGDGIGWVEIDFTGDAGVAGGFGALEKIGVEGAGVTFAAGGGRSDYAIDVHKIGVGVFVVVRVFLVGFFEEGAEPEKIYVLVARGLIEGDEQSVGIVDGGGEKGFADE
jgi:hypothetical protein